MGWWLHDHRWHAKTDLSTVKGSDGKVTGSLFIEACSCGAVRQIEFRPGEAPKIFVTSAAPDQQREMVT